MSFKGEDNFSKTTKDGHIMHKQGCCSHAKKIEFIKITKTIHFKKMILKCESCIESV